jgi:hypothetical protein
VSRGHRRRHTGDTEHCERRDDRVRRFPWDVFRNPRACCRGARVVIRNRDCLASLRLGTGLAFGLHDSAEPARSQPDPQE